MAGHSRTGRLLPSARRGRTDEYAHLRADIDIPVRLLWGREDRITPPPLGAWLRDHIRHETMSWIDNAGHLLQEDAPAQLLAALLEA